MSVDIEDLAQLVIGIAAASQAAIIRAITTPQDPALPARVRGNLCVIAGIPSTQGQAPTLNQLHAHILLRCLDEQQTNLKDWVLREIRVRQSQP